MSIAARRTPTHAAAHAASEARPVDSTAARTYAGLVTRALAFALDAALISLVAMLVAAVVVLGLSVLKLPHELRVVAAALGGVAYALWCVGYFVTFWVTTGQTPGSRVLRIRVLPARGGRLPPRRAIVRFAGLILAALPLFAGFLWILVDDRRRGLQDLIARTVVVDAGDDGANGAGPRARA